MEMLQTQNYCMLTDKAQKHKNRVDSQGSWVKTELRQPEQP
jgi:hypothetical protein